MKIPDYSFLKRAGRILNSGQARALVLTGSIHDLFCLSRPDAEEDYVPLLDLLIAQWNVPDLILIVYELNGPVRFVQPADSDKVRNAWLKWRIGMNSDQLAIKRMLSHGKSLPEEDAAAKTYDDSLRSATSNPTLALELLRQLCLCSRSTLGGVRILSERLLILIEGADLLIPEAPITSLSDVDRQRVAIFHDWFGDPGFMNGGDSAVLLAESRSLLHHRVGRLPQLLEVEVPSPDESVRGHFISWFNRSRDDDEKIKLWGTQTELARFTAGLSIHALMQLLRGAVHDQKKLTQTEVIAKVEDYIKSQLGDEIVEFKKPAHSFADVVGFTQLKTFLKKELIPRFQSHGPGALSGAAVCGPIGGGKTFIFEAVATELDMVVLVLKNIRSQWFGQTDVIFERLKRVLEALGKVLIFVDEADTQLGGVGPATHETERRLTGKIQAMMSDPRLRGRVIWLLVTARIHLLSPDLRRPGRVGDLIIPTLDPAGDDRKAFLEWMVKPVLTGKLTEEQFQVLDTLTAGYSAASFASLRSEFKAKANQSEGNLEFDELLAVANDHIAPAIEETRRYQTLQALVNCTRKSLLPDPNVTEDQRRRWAQELRELEARGIK